MRLAKAILDFTSALAIILPVIAVILAYYFTMQGLAEATKEIGRLAAERVIVVKGNCPVTIVRQT